MARIANIHPKLWRDPRFVSVSPAVRLLYIGLLTLSMRGSGRFEWRPDEIAALLGIHADEIADMLAALVQVDLVVREVISGRDFGTVRKVR